MNKIRIAGAAAGVVLVSGMVLQVSSAAFTDTTENADNNWDAGSVYLTDDDSDVAMFQPTGVLGPTYSETNCIQVTYQGSLTPGGPITLDAILTESPDAAGGDGLGDDLNVKIEVGASGTTCGTMVALTNTTIHNAALSTLGAPNPLSTGWTPAPDAVLLKDMSRPFKFTVTMPNPENDAQGDSVSADFVWASTS